MVHFNNSWDNLLKDEFKKDYYLRLRRFLIEEYRTQTIYPGMYDIFNAMKITSYEDVKCVIIGQDPYHEPGQAMGLSFSVNDGIPCPPSLVNIFKEIKADTGIDNFNKGGNLTKWAESGVLLLNSVLTVRRGKANSHKGAGWENFTDDVIRLLNLREKPMVFLLWGRNAKEKASLVTNPAHLVLEAAHPSPLSAYNGFFGCRHFSKTNRFLTEQKIEPVNWQI